MSYDITFHPITNAELDDHVFNAIRDPNVVQELIERSPYSATEKEGLAEVYAVLAKGYQEAPKQKTVSFFAYTAAAIAGLLRPYWWGLSTTFVNLPNYDTRYRPLIQSLATQAPDLFGDVHEERPGRLYGNYSGGGFIPHENIARFRKNIAEDFLEDQEELMAWAGLIFALEYAEKYQTGILEADGVYDRMRGCVTDPDNMRTCIVQVGFPYVYLAAPADTDSLYEFTNEWLKKTPEEYAQSVRGHLI